MAKWLSAEILDGFLADDMKLSWKKRAALNVENASLVVLKA